MQDRRRSITISNCESKSLDLTIPGDFSGLRLDQALVQLLPNMRRRSVRRLLGDCEVLVDGTARAAGFRVSGGEQVRISSPVEVDGKDAPDEDRSSVIEVAGRNADFVALVKPAGMHCEALPGRSFVIPGLNLSGTGGVSPGQTVQGALANLYPEAVPVLLNRLDQPVSGLVLAALHEKAARDYAVLQDQGRVRKSYLAVVRGDLQGKRLVRATLDTAKRRKVRAVDVVESDALRWTRVYPVARDVERDATLIRVEIRKGRRHQIRAHLASIGHPVLYDPLYGADPDQGWIALHHERIELPGFEVCVKPDWRELAMYADMNVTCAG